VLWGGLLTVPPGRPKVSTCLTEGRRQLPLGDLRSRLRGLVWRPALILSLLALPALYSAMGIENDDIQPSGNAIPVIQRASDEAKKATAAATSAGLPIPIG